METVVLTSRQCAFEEIASGYGAMAVMGTDGDTKTIWDRHSPAEVEAARKHFKELLGKGFAAFKCTKDGKQGEQVREFDANEERYIFVGPMAGG